MGAGERLGVGDLVHRGAALGALAAGFGEGDKDGVGGVFVARNHARQTGLGAGIRGELGEAALAGHKPFAGDAELGAIREERGAHGVEGLTGCELFDAVQQRRVAGLEAGVAGLEAGGAGFEAASPVAAVCMLRHPPCPPVHPAVPGPPDGAVVGWEAAPNDESNADIATAEAPKPNIADRRESVEESAEE